MRHKITYYSLIFTVIGFVGLLTVPARAHTSNREADDFSNAVVTLAAGQTLRISVANSLPGSAQGRDSRKFKMLFAATVFDTKGRVIANSNEVTLGPGEFHSFDFNRADLPPSGEPGTGRLQLRCEIRRHTFPGFGGGVRVAADDLNEVVEIIDNLTGQTEAQLPLHNDIDLANRDERPQVQPSLLGLAYGQSLRVNVAHLSGGAQRQILRARIALNDASGNPIAQSSELAISPGEFRSYDFSRGDLLLIGEPGTGRVQMAANIVLKFDSENLGPVSATLELVDNSSGMQPHHSWLWLSKR